MKSVVQPPGFGPVMLLWLTVQLVALAVGGLGLTLSATTATPPQAWATEEVLVAQLLAAVLLGPIVFAESRRSVAAIVSTIPFLLAGAFLSATPWEKVGVALPIELLWLTAIALLSHPRSGAANAVRLILVLFVVDDVWVNYLRVEWTDQAAALIGPISNTLSALHSDFSRVTYWPASLACSLATAFHCLITAQLKISGSARTTSYPQV